MKKLVLFYNPVSGHAAFKNKLDWMIEAFQRRGILLLLYRTKKEGNEEFASFVRAVQPDGILAAGGDGTVHECVNLMVRHGLNIPIGIIGSGTSNDFATYLKINEDMERYFACIADGKTKRMDLGRVGETYFINVASAGMMTGIAHEVPSRLKNALGKFAYYLRGIGELPKMRAMQFHVKADGREYDFDGYLFVIVNSATVASLHDVAPCAAIDDGMLDFLAIRKGNVPQLMRVCTELLSGHSVLENPHILHIQASSFEVTSDAPLVSDLDGEAGPALPLKVETVPRAVQVFCFT